MKFSKGNVPLFGRGVQRELRIYGAGKCCNGCVLSVSVFPPVGFPTSPSIR